MNTLIYDFGCTRHLSLLSILFGSGVTGSEVGICFLLVEAANSFSIDHQLWLSSDTWNCPSF